jgi:hypothetical protein
LNAPGTCIIEASVQLIEAKEQCEHGDWLPWLAREFGWSERQARDLMQIAEVFGSNRH